jgi:HK97 family phage prohead protease
MEHKNCSIIEFKFAETEAGTMSFEGYGAVFGNVDSYGDVIAPGAFTDTLAQFKEAGTLPSMLAQHGGMGMGADDLTPIGKWLEMSEDDTGLMVKGQLADTERGRDMHTLMKMKAIDGLSIGYRVKESSPSSKAGTHKRTLTKLDLLEISPVTFPANGEARIHAVKSIDEITTVGEVEEVLRDAGFSRKNAKNLIAKVKDNLRDADESESLVSILKRNNTQNGY